MTPVLTLLALTLAVAVATAASLQAYRARLARDAEDDAWARDWVRVLRNERRL